MKHLIVGVMISLVLACFLFSQTKWTLDNMVKDWFKDPIERMYMVMFNCARFEVHSGYENKISIAVGQMEEILNENGYKWSDVILIIHNHFANPHFSPADQKTYYEIKRRGFRGVFAIYVTATGQVNTMREVPRREVEAQLKKKLNDER